MRQFFAALAIATMTTAPIAGQAWTSEIGIVGGFARIKPAGTGQHDYIDRVELPGNGASYATLFVVIPLSARVALEPAIGGSRTAFKEARDLIPRATDSNVRLSLRADVALASRVYGAAGGMLRYRQIDDVRQVQVGILAALGYRQPLGADVSARIETQWMSQRGTDSISPSNIYALLLGFSGRLGGPSASTATSYDSSSGRTRPWRLGLAIAGGYARTHLYGSALGLYLDAYETAIDLPGSGSTTPPALSIVVPLHGRFALETGFDALRRQQQGSTLSDAQLSTRLNLAVHRGGYVAGGGNIRYVEQTGSSGFAFAGASVAAGYRFPLIKDLDARMEVSFTAFKERRDFPFAQNTLAVLTGLTMALK